MREASVILADAKNARAGKTKETLFFPLPASVQKPILGGCQCKWCKEHSGAIPMWDTLAIDKHNVKRTWTVHYPELPR